MKEKKRPYLLKLLATKKPEAILGFLEGFERAKKQVKDSDVIRFEGIRRDGNSLNQGSTKKTAHLLVSGLLILFDFPGNCLSCDVIYLFSFRENGQFGG